MKCSECKAVIPNYHPYVTVHPTVVCEAEENQDICVHCAPVIIKRYKDTKPLSLYQFVSRRRVILPEDKAQFLEACNSWHFDTDEIVNLQLFYVYPGQLYIWRTKSSNIYLTLGSVQYEATDQEGLERLELNLYRYYLNEFFGLDVTIEELIQ